MSTETTTDVRPVPEWLHVGARVAILTGRSGPRSNYDEAVVAKITKTQVVLASGDRHRLSDLTQTGRGAWDSVRTLSALDSERAVESRRFQGLRLARRLAIKALGDFSKAIEQSDYDAALPDPYDLIAEITRLHAESRALHAAAPKED